MTYPMTVVDTMFKALAPAIPDRVIAGHHADLLVAAVPWHQSADRGILHCQLGAARRRLGCQAQRGRHVGHRMHQRRRHAQHAERAGRGEVSGAWSSATRWSEDSGGAGRHRGGLGIERVVRARTNMTINTQTDRAHCRRGDSTAGVMAPATRSPCRIGGTWKDGLSQCQDAGGAPQDRAMLSHALGRRRRLRLAVRAADRGRCRTTCGRATCRSRPRRSSMAS